MELAEIIRSLERSGAAIVALYQDLQVEAAGRHPAPDEWSLLEILCHLCDEERDDFGTRLRLTIESPETDWPGIDPQGWVIARDYASQALAEKLDEFEVGRMRTLAWLATLEDGQMAARHTHPKFGSMAAGDLLASWAAHDLLHLAQICRARIELVRRAAGPYSTAYAMP